MPITAVPTGTVASAGSGASAGADQPRQEHGGHLAEGAEELGDRQHDDVAHGAPPCVPADAAW